MEDRTKRMERVIENVVKSHAREDKEGNFECDFCGKLYKAEKTCVNHVRKEHGNDDLITVQIDEAYQKSIETEIHMYEGWIVREIEKPFKSYQEAKEEFVKRVEEDGPTETILWNASKMILAEAKFNLTKPITQIYGDTPNDLDRIKQKAEYLIEVYKDDLIDRPYEGGSTNDFSNNIEMIKCKAKSEMVSNYNYSIGGGSLPLLVKLIEETEELEKELD